MCPLGHDTSEVEVKPDGKRICTACRDTFAARRRQHNKAHKLSKNRQEGATTHARTS